MPDDLIQPMSKENRCVNILTWMRYLEEFHPEISVDELLMPILNNNRFLVLDENTGNLKSVDKEYLLNPDNWISSELTTEIYIRGREATNDPLFSYKVGRETDYLLGTGFKRTGLKLMNPKDIVKRIPAENAKLNRTKQVEVVINEKNHAVVRLHFKKYLVDNHLTSKEACSQNIGAYESFAMLTGNLASIKETCCTFEGSDYCEFDIQWVYKPFLKRLLNLFKRILAKDLIDDLEEKEKKNLELIHNQERIIELRTEDLRKEKDKADNAQKILSRYVAPQLAKKILEGQVEEIWGYHRKKLTMFFSDLSNFSGLTDNLEPEDMANLLNEYLSSMHKIVQKHDGTLAQIEGDGLYVFFGAPEATNDIDHAIRCVKMAIDMQLKMRELQKKWFEEGIEDVLEIRCGINTGIATVGGFGSEDRKEYTAMGSHTIIASRLESVCVPGEIIISHSTWALIKDEIKCEGKKQVEVKGFHRPIRTYKVLF